MGNNQLILKPGDIVDIIAPGFRCKPADIKKAVKKIKSWGLRARVPKDLFGKDVVCSNSDEKRWKHLKHALFAKDSKLIWCARGGYGSIRLLDQMQKLKAPRHKKWILGYSDISSLHSFVHSRWGWPALHGPLFERFGQNKLRAQDEAALKKIIYGEVSHIIFRNLTPLNSSARKNKTIGGQIVGGNLTVVASTVGLPWEFNTSGKILFFEDIGERGYRVDRILKYLEQTKFLNGVKAIIFGEFIGGQELSGKSLCLPVIKRFANQQKIPVLVGLPVGHGDLQATIPIGAQVKLKLGQRAVLDVKV